MVFDLPSRLTKSETMMLEMIKENNWKRPIYVAVTVAEEYYPSSVKNTLNAQVWLIMWFLWLRKLKELLM